MPLAEHKTIPVRILFIRRIHVHNIKVQGNQRVRAGQGTAGMPGTGHGCHPDHILTNQPGLFLQHRDFHRIIPPCCANY